MKEYKRPEIQIVNLKSSEDIASKTFESLRNGMVNSYLMKNGNKYAITKYAVTDSIYNNATDTPVVEG